MRSNLIGLLNDAEIDLRLKLEVLEMARALGAAVPTAEKLAGEALHWAINIRGLVEGALNKGEVE